MLGERRMPYIPCERLMVFVFSVPLVILWDSISPTLQECPGKARINQIFRIVPDNTNPGSGRSFHFTFPHPTL